MLSLRAEYKRFRESKNIRSGSDRALAKSGLDMMDIISGMFSVDGPRQRVAAMVEWLRRST